MAKGGIQNEAVVEELVQRPEFSGGKLVFVDSTDCFYVFVEGKLWRPTLAKEMKRKIFEHLIVEHVGKKVTDSLVSDVYRLLIYRVPWKTNLDGEYISFNDCLLNPETFETAPHGIERFATFHIPMDYAAVQASPHERFDKFLSEVLVTKDGVTDHSLMKVVQEILGCLISPSLDAASAFFFVGDGANGKSILANLIRAIVGDEYISAMSIETLTMRPFAVANLLGKKVNLCNEEESKFVKSDKFKALISGDLVSAERKFGNPFEFQPKAKYLFCSNDLPSFDGLNYGLRRRIKIIPFNRIFQPHERQPTKQLLGSLIEEKPGIVGWALEGLKRLVVSGWVFSDAESASMREAMAEFEAEISSTIAFISESYEVSDNGFISNAMLYQQYKAWCDLNGKKAHSSRKFHKQLLKNVDGLKSIWGREPNGPPVRGKNFDRKIDLPLPPSGEEVVNTLDAFERAL